MHNHNPQELIKTLRYQLEEAEKGLESGSEVKYKLHIAKIYGLLFILYTREQQHQGGNKWLM